MLQGFRLHVADTSGEAAGIVAGFADHFGSAVPLLTSIDDRRDVAMVPAVRAGSDRASISSGVGRSSY